MLPNNQGGPPPPNFPPPPLNFPPPPHMAAPGFPFPGPAPPNMFGPLNPNMAPKPPMPMGMPGPMPMGLGIPPHGPLLHLSGHVPGTLGRPPIIHGAPMVHPGMVPLPNMPVVRAPVSVAPIQTHSNTSSTSTSTASTVTTTATTPSTTTSANAGKTNTIFVNNICSSVDEATIRAILGTCGSVQSWKKMTTFGFCEYETVEQVKRAVRILNGLKVGDQELKIKMDEKTEKAAAEQEGKETDEERDTKDAETREKLAAIVPDKSQRSASPSRDSEKSGNVSRDSKNKDTTKDEEETERRNKEKEAQREKKKDAEYRRQEQLWEHREKEKEVERARDAEKEERRSKAKEKEKMKYLLENYQSDSDEDEKMKEKYFRSHREQLRRKWKRDRYDDQSLIAEEARKEYERLQKAIYQETLRQQQEEQERDNHLVPMSEVEAQDSQYQSGESNGQLGADDVQGANPGESEMEELGDSEQSKASLPSSSFSLSLKRGLSQSVTQSTVVTETVQKRRSLSNVFNPDDPDDIDPLFRRKSNLELDERKSELTYAPASSTKGAEKGAAGPVAPQASNTGMGGAKLTPEEMKKIIDRIPTEKELLFQMPVDWAVATRGDVMDKLRVWISKKINEYLGMSEESIANIVVENLKNQIKPESLVSELEELLENEAERFVVMLWRKMLFEVLCVV